MQRLLQRGHVGLLADAHPADLVEGVAHLVVARERRHGHRLAHAAHAGRARQVGGEALAEAADARASLLREGGRGDGGRGARLLRVQHARLERRDDLGPAHRAVWQHGHLGRDGRGAAADGAGLVGRRARERRRAGDAARREPGVLVGQRRARGLAVHGADDVGDARREDRAALVHVERNADDVRHAVRQLVRRVDRVHAERDERGPRVRAEKVVEVRHEALHLGEVVGERARRDRDADDGHARVDRRHELHHAVGPREDGARLHHQHARVLAHVVPEPGEVLQVVAVEEAAPGRRGLQLLLQPPRLRRRLDLVVRQEAREAGGVAWSRTRLGSFPAARQPSWRERAAMSARGRGLPLLLDATRGGLDGLAAPRPLGICAESLLGLLVSYAVPRDGGTAQRTQSHTRNWHLDARRGEEKRAPLTHRGHVPAAASRRPSGGTKDALEAAPKVPRQDLERVP